MSRAKDLLRRVVPRAARTPARRIFWWGTRHRCPVCGARVRRYLPDGRDLPVLRELDVVGGEHWPERTCPVCFADTRARLVWWYLESECRILERRIRVLHLAPEPGIYRRLRAARALSYHVADREPAHYAFADAICKLDATALPYADARFDVVLANHVLEHIEDDARALAEIRRVLRPGGFALLQVPIALRLARTLEDPGVRSPEERERTFGQRDHVRLYGRDYVDRLAGAGFEVRCCAAHASLPPELQARWLVNPREVLFVATRPV